MLLGELGRRVHVARVGRRVLRDQAGAERGAAPGAGRLEAAGVQVVPAARARRDGPVQRAPVPALAVHHHRTGEDEVPHRLAGHRGEQHRGAQVVAAGVGGRVVEVQPQAHHRRLVADRVHPGERLPDGGGVPYVPPPELHPGGQRRHRPGGMHGGQQRVQHPDFVARRHQGPDDRRTDEPGAAGDQNPHARRRYRPGTARPRQDADASRIRKG